MEKLRNICALLIIIRQAHVLLILLIPAAATPPLFASPLIQQKDAEWKLQTNMQRLIPITLYLGHNVIMHTVISVIPWRQTPIPILGQIKKSQQRIK